MNDSWREFLLPEAVIWLALLVLLGLTLAAAFVLSGTMGTTANIAIAVAKALLVVLFFMHLRHSSNIIRLASILGILWLGLMLTLTIADFLAR